MILAIATSLIALVGDPYDVPASSRHQQQREVQPASPPTPSPDSPTGPSDERRLLRLFPAEDGVAVYWSHDDERADPFRSLLIRTMISRSGEQRGAAQVVLERSDFAGYRVDGDAAAGLLALWQQGDEIYTSPLAGATALVPEGTHLGTGRSPEFWSGSDGGLVAYGDERAGWAIRINTGGRPVGTPFPLPAGWWPRQFHIDADGIFYVRNTLDSVRAALLTGTGAWFYDVEISPVRPAAFDYSPLAITAGPNGDDLVVYTERQTDPDEVRAVRISREGVLGSPVLLWQARPQEKVSRIAIGWNGAEYLLAGSYSSGLSDAFVLRFDAGLDLLGPVALPPEFRMSITQVLPLDDGGWALGWSRTGLFVMFVSADGVASAAIPVTDAVGRRRAVSH